MVEDLIQEEKIDIQWVTEEEYKEFDANFERIMRHCDDGSDEDVFETLEKETGWSEFYTFQDSRPREIAEMIQSAIELGANLHAQGEKTVKLMIYGDGIWLK